MAKRLTPIERVIAGEPTDRRRRYEQRMRARGFARVTVNAAFEDIPLIHRLGELSRRLPADQFQKIVQDILAQADDAEGRTERPQRSEDAPRAPSAPGSQGQ